MLVIVAGIIAVGTRLGGPLLRYAALIFWGGVVGGVLAVWGCGLLFSYVEHLGARQTPYELTQKGWLGAELTIEEIQRMLLTPGEQALNVAALYYKEPIPYPPQGGRYALLAYLLWPLQFQLVRDLLALMGVITFISVVAMFGIWWERKVAGNATGSRPEESEAEELRRLRRDVTVLQQERDFLKKAAAFFAKESE